MTMRTMLQYMLSMKSHYVVIHKLKSKVKYTILVAKALLKEPPTQQINWHIIKVTLLKSVGQKVNELPDT